MQYCLVKYNCPSDLHELGSLNNQIICEVCFDHKYTCMHSFKTSVLSYLSSVQRRPIHSLRMNDKPLTLAYRVPTPTPISSPAPSPAHICSSCFSWLFLKKCQAHAHLKVRVGVRLAVPSAETAFPQVSTAYSLYTQVPHSKSPLLTPRY